MASSNLEALNALIEKIRAGEGTAKSNLEALNMLCVIAGGTGAARSNLEALNELLRVFTPGGETQEKSVTITENGTTEIIPDEGFTLSKAIIETAVPSKPEQTKAVTITENGTTEITPDAGFTLSGASVSVSVSGGSDYNLFATRVGYVQNEIYRSITKVDFTKIDIKPGHTLRLFSGLSSLKDIIWGNFLADQSGNRDSNQMFSQCESIENIDLSSGGNITWINTSQMFYGCKKLKSIIWGGSKIKSDTIVNAFYNCSSLEELDLSNMDTTVLDSSMYGHDTAFSGCSKLKNIIFENNCFSTEGMNKIYFTACPLTHDCAVDIFNKLATRSNSPVLKLSTTTKGYLTNDEIAIATNKGWVIS